MQMMEPRFYASPVDYEAWRKGYMPPTEHVLIHKLSVGDVKVVTASDMGSTGWWLCVKGRLTKAQRRAMLQIFEIMEDIEVEEDTALAAKASEPAQEPHNNLTHEPASTVNETVAKEGTKTD